MRERIDLIVDWWFIVIKMICRKSRAKSFHTQFSTIALHILTAKCCAYDDEFDKRWIIESISCVDRFSKYLHRSRIIYNFDSGTKFYFPEMLYRKLALPDKIIIAWLFIPTQWVKEKKISMILRRESVRARMKFRVWLYTKFLTSFL